MEKFTPERARSHNTQLVLKTIYESGPISRAALARVTGLAPPTVSEVVADLIAQGLVEELGYGPSTGGKRPVLLDIVRDSRYLISLSLARECFCGALINLRGEIVHRVDLPLHGRDGDEALRLVYAAVDALVAVADHPLLGIGIGAPGLVDAVDGVMWQAINLNWREVPLRRLLQERYGLPVYIANDCQVAALGERTFGARGIDLRDLVVINVEFGVGAGIVLHGRLLYGNPLGAGEIGHVVVDPEGELCRCGNRGCLEACVSTRAIVRRAQALARSTPDSLLHRFAVDPAAITFDTVCRAFEADDPTMRRLIQDVGCQLGAVIAYLVGAFGSCRVLIAGPLARFGPFLLDVMRAETAGRCLPSLVANSEIGYTSLGSDIVLLGASALLLHHELGLFASAWA